MDPRPAHLGLLRDPAPGQDDLYTTHHLDEAEVLCDRVAIMDHGRILAIDSPAELVRGLDAPTRVSLPAGVIDAAAAGRLRGADGVTGDGEEVVVATRQPALLLGALAEADRLDGVGVPRPPWGLIPPAHRTGVPA